MRKFRVFCDGGRSFGRFEEGGVKGNTSRLAVTHGDEVFQMAEFRQHYGQVFQDRRFGDKGYGLAVIEDSLNLQYLVLGV